MLSRSRLEPWRFAVPLAVFGSAAMRARLDAGPAAAAETGFLGLLGAAMLVCLAARAGADGRITALAGGLVAAALWALPPGELRGAVVTAVLVGGAAAALPELWRRPEPASATALAIALQLLFRGEVLITHGLDGALLLELILLPTGGALALLAIGGPSRRRAWIAAAGLLALGGGFSAPLVAAAALLAAATGPGLGRRPLGWLALALAVAALGDSWLALGWALPAAVLWRGRGRPAWRIAGIALAGALAVAAVAGGGARGAAAALAGWAWLPILLPGALGCRRGRWPDLAATALVALASLFALPPAAGLPAAVLALAGGARLPAAAAVIQRWWSAALLLASSAAAAYPWLRARPAETALAALGLDPSWPAAAAVAAGFWLVAGLAAVFAWQRPGWVPQAGAGALLAGAVLLAARPIGPQALAAPVTLTAAAGSVTREVRPPAGVRAAVVDSFLANSVELEPGREVARLRLFGPDGQVAEKRLRFGRETFEWAARRPGTSLPAGPPAWLSWVAPDGAYPAQRYRAVLAVAGLPPVDRVEIVRSPGLPAAVEVMILGLELQ